MSQFRILTNLDIYIAVVTIIRKCNKFSVLRIASPFLSDIPPVFLNRISDELPRKASKGASIRILTHPPRRNGILFLLDRWLEAGVKIKVNPRVHGKIFLFSRKIVEDNRLIKEEYTTLIGSANLTRAGLSVLDRANLEIVLRSHKRNIFDRVQQIYTKWWLTRESEDYFRWKLKFRRQKLGGNNK